MLAKPTAAASASPGSVVNRPWSSLPNLPQLTSRWLPRGVDGWQRAAGDVPPGVAGVGHALDEQCPQRAPRLRGHHSA
jgi:hypothetical protein